MLRYICPKNVSTLMFYLNFLCCIFRRKSLVIVDVVLVYPHMHIILTELDAKLRISHWNDRVRRFGHQVIHIMAVRLASGSNLTQGTALQHCPRSSRSARLRSLSLPTYNNYRQEDLSWVLLRFPIVSSIYTAPYHDRRHHLLHFN